MKIFGFRSLFFLAAASVLTLALLAGNCAKDKSDGKEGLTNYLLFCPAGIQGCYQGCADRWDLDNSGHIDPVEEPDYKTCTATCDSYCSLLFLLSL